MPISEVGFPASTYSTYRWTCDCADCGRTHDCNVPFLSRPQDSWPFGPRKFPPEWNLDFLRNVIDARKRLTFCVSYGVRLFLSRDEGTIWVCVRPSVGWSVTLSLFGLLGATDAVYTALFWRLNYTFTMQELYFILRALNHLFEGDSCTNQWKDLSLDASSHLYSWVCLSVCPSVGWLHFRKNLRKSIRTHRRPCSVECKENVSLM